MIFTIPEEQMKAYEDAAKAVAGVSLMAFGNYVLKTPHEILAEFWEFLGKRMGFILNTCKPINDTDFEADPTEITDNSCGIFSPKLYAEITPTQVTGR